MSYSPHNKAVNHAEVEKAWAGPRLLALPSNQGNPFTLSPAATRLTSGLRSSVFLIHSQSCHCGSKSNIAPDPIWKASLLRLVSGPQDKMAWIVFVKAKLLPLLAPSGHGGLGSKSVQPL